MLWKKNKKQEVSGTLAGKLSRWLVYACRFLLANTSCRQVLLLSCSKCSRHDVLMHGSPSCRLQKQLQSLGLAGVAAYGLLNTGYYISAFLFFWFAVAKVPAGQGLAATARAVAGVMAGVWAGSQVTKAARAAAALMLAPLVDRLMGGLQRRLRLRTKRAVSGLALPKTHGGV